MGRTIVYGPHASGKTRNAKALAKHFGHRNIVDGYDDYIKAPHIPGDALVLMQQRPSNALRARLGARVFEIRAALGQLRGASQ